jgi:hypothetical protein
MRMRERSRFTSPLYLFFSLWTLFCRWTRTQLVFNWAVKDGNRQCQDDHFSKDHRENRTFLSLDAIMYNCKMDFNDHTTQLLMVVGRFNKLVVNVVDRDVMHKMSVGYFCKSSLILLLNGPIKNGAFKIFTGDISIK